jgi:HTH-type transcriptional regulator / antitoxin HigA
MTALERELTGKLSKKRVGRQEYQDLIGRTLPHVIGTEAENAHYLRVLEALDRQPRLTPAQAELAALLTLLIEDFEDRHYALKPATPIEHLQELMRAQGLRQKDLVDIFGTPSIVSEVLHGKRALTADHIRRLSARFHVSPALFL